jgi:hypothetical protein
MQAKHFLTSGEPIKHFFNSEDEIFSKLTFFFAASILASMMNS